MTDMTSSDFVTEWASAFANYSDFEIVQAAQELAEVERDEFEEGVSEGFDSFAAALPDAKKQYKVYLDNPKTGRQYVRYCLAESEAEANERCAAGLDEDVPISELPEMWVCHAVEIEKLPNRWG
jgi:hypothetical protein